MSAGWCPWRPARYRRKPRWSASTAREYVVVEAEKGQRCLLAPEDVEWGRILGDMTHRFSVGDVLNGAFETTEDGYTRYTLLAGQTNPWHAIAAEFAEGRDLQRQGGQRDRQPRRVHPGGPRRKRSGAHRPAARVRLGGHRHRAEGRGRPARRSRPKILPPAAHRRRERGRKRAARRSRRATALRRPGDCIPTTYRSSVTAWTPRSVGWSRRTASLAASPSSCSRAGGGPCCTARGCCQT